jgi:AraC family transcriptional regulator, exoenzyme S synthesis regulatory protein ExsA
MLNIYDYIKAHPEEFKQFSCKELLFLIIDCPPDFTSSEDWAEHNCFLYVITGRHILFSRERSWFLKQGDTMFMKKGGCGIQKVDEDIFCALMFYVPDSYLRSFIRERVETYPAADPSLGSNDLVLPVETNVILTTFFDSVISYFTAGKQPPEDLLELKFRELLLNIITNPSNKKLTAHLYKLFLTNADELQEIMERNFLYNLQLHEFARLCHRSLSKFKRDFKAVFGTAPGHWLLEKRLQAARDLLLKTNKTILEICMESGFTNNAHFDRVFKKNFGKSPLQYRKKASANSIQYYLPTI